MTWLSVWIKELCLIVLLAGFIDLLLPNRCMERYVKLVLSLIILFTLISPLTRFLTDNPILRLNEAMATFDPKKNNTTSTSSDELKRILEEGKTIQRQHSEKVVDWVAQKVAQLMKEEIEQKINRTVNAVHVTLVKKEQRNDGSTATSVPIIQSVQVSVLRSITQNHSKYHIKHVDAIKVPFVSVSQPSVVLKEKNVAETNAKRTGGHVDETTVHKIKLILYERWQVKPEHVQVI